MDIKIYLNLLPKTIVKVFLQNKTVDLLKFARDYLGVIYKLFCKKYGNLESVSSVEIEVMIEGVLLTIRLEKRNLRIIRGKSVIYSFLP